MEIIIATFLYIALWYWVNNIDKRLKVLEEVRGSIPSHRLNINGYYAAIEFLLDNKNIVKSTKIKSAILKKQYKDWTKAEQSQIEKLLKEAQFEQKLSVNITYLQSENAYFVRSQDNVSYIIHSDSGKNLIYSAIIFGDTTGLGERIEFLVYERIIRINDAYHKVLTPCLKYHDGHILDGKREFKVICDFPLRNTGYDDQLVEQLGFKVESIGGDDVYTDSFGETESLSLIKTYKKNRLEITYSL